MELAVYSSWRADICIVGCIGFVMGRLDGDYHDPDTEWVHVLRLINHQIINVMRLRYLRHLGGIASPGDEVGEMIPGSRRGHHFIAPDVKDIRTNSKHRTNIYPLDSNISISHPQTELYTHVITDLS